MVIIIITIALSYRRIDKQKSKNNIIFSSRKNQTYVVKTKETAEVINCDDGINNGECPGKYSDVLTEAEKTTWDIAALETAIGHFITNCHQKSCEGNCKSLISKKTFTGKVETFYQDFIDNCNPLPPPTATPVPELPPPTATPAPELPPPTATPAPELPPPTATPQPGGVPPPTATPQPGEVPPPTATPQPGEVPPPTAAPEQSRTEGEKEESSETPNSGDNDGKGGNDDNGGDNNADSSFNRFGVNTMLVILCSIVTSIQLVLME
jgi:hypothetical protein